MRIETQATKTRAASWKHPGAASVPTEIASPWSGLLRECRDMALEFSTERLGDLFNHTDHAFLDFAEKAESNQVQGLFFEAMYEVRDKRPRMVQRFLDQLQTGFDEFGHNDTPGQDKADKARAKLSLVPWEEMDESVAVESLIDRTRHDCHEQLYALGKRLEVINGGHEIKEEAVPSGPWQMVSSFRSALREVSTDTKVKLILYAMFDKFVLKEANGIYQVFNDNLIENGILPDLRPTIVPQPEEGKRPARQQMPPAAPEANNAEMYAAQTSRETLGEELFQSVLGLMAAQRTPDGGPHPLPANPLPRELLESVIDAIQPVLGRPGVPGSAGKTASAGETTSGEVGGELSGAAAGAGLGRVEGAGAGAASGQVTDAGFGKAATDGEVPSLGQQRGGAGEAASLPQRLGFGAAPASEADSAGEAARDQVDFTAQTSALSASAFSEDDLVPDVDIDEAFLDKIRTALTDERNRLFTKIDRDRLNVADADTIELVGMLFEYMLIDPLLPNLAKALISRLHTPYLKVAIKDLRMRTDYEHPARRLLDELVEAGGKWVHENDRKRGIFPAMQTAVLRVLTEFTDDVGLFDELLTDFRDAMEEQRRKTEVIELRTREAAKGREKLEVATQRATKEMKVRVQRTRLPQPVARFLTRVWTDRLKFVLLRHADGEGSQEWREALETADRLVRLFDPETALAERGGSLDVLRASIHAGLESLGSASKETCDALFEILENLERGDAAWTMPCQETGSQPCASPLPTNNSASTPEEDADCSPEAPHPELEAMVKRLRQIDFGTWFQFRDEPSDKPRRLKLSWLSPITSACMFVDPAGVQAAIKSLPVLAQEILDGRATVIERPKEPFVRRTLKTIYSMLDRRRDY